MIQQRLIEHTNCINKELDNKYLHFFTALHGSQNYGVEYNQSDVDTRTIIIPFDSFDTNWVNSMMFVPPESEHADIKDIRIMFDLFSQQMSAYLEILFTPYVNVNPLFQEQYNVLHENRETIAHLNPYLGMKMTVQHIMDEYNLFDNPHSHILKADVITKYGYDPKLLHHMVRLQELLQRYIIDGDSFEDCLKTKQPERLIEIKQGCIPSKQAFILREDIKNWAIDFENAQKHILSKTYNSQGQNILNTTLTECFAITKQQIMEAK